MNLCNRKCKGKNGKVSVLKNQAMKLYRVMEVKLQAFLILAPNGGE